MGTGNKGRGVSGKTITVFLTEGDPQGTRIARIGGWTGIGVASSRHALTTLLKRPEAQKAGLYILAGVDPDDVSVERVYIGQSEPATTRLAQHEKSKDFWSRAVVFTSADESLTRGHLEYLEARVIEMAHASNKAFVENKTKPVRALPEHERVVMEDFLDEMQVLLPVLGFSFLRYEAEPGDIEPVRFVMRDSGTEAYAIESGEDFIVLAGSTARKIPTPSFAGGAREKRQRLIESGVLVDSDDTDLYVFSKDTPFSSTSAAADVVAAASRNGRTSWKHEESGLTYAEWTERQVSEALNE